MKKIHLPKIGMRTVKTAVSVMICLILGRIIGGGPPFAACVAAVLTVRETVENSMSHGVSRFLASLIGGVLGILTLMMDLGSYFWLEALVICAGIIVCIYSSLLIKKPDAAALSCSVFLMITLQHADDKYLFALHRLFDTILGVTVAIIVNRFLNFRTVWNGNPDGGADVK